MSINIFMIPIALAVRAVMGKENFDNWAKETEVVYKTRIKDREKLVDIIEKSGYDAVSYGNLLKTHFGKKYFWWEKREGVWIAVFSTYDDENAVSRILSKMNGAYGNKLFISEKDSKSKVKSIKTKTFPTNFKDSELLIKTLEEYGVKNIEIEHENIKCKIDRYEMKFFKGEEEFFYVKFRQTGSLEAVCRQLDLIDEEYKKNIQSYTYEKIKDSIEENNNVEVLNEYVDEEETLVLTLEVK